MSAPQTRGSAPEAIEDSIALRVAVLIALVVAGIAVLRESGGTPTLWAVVLVGYPATYGLAYAARRHRPALLRTIVNVLALFIMVGFVSAFGAAANVADLQVPLAEVFLWLLLVQGLETTTRRGLLVSLVASLVLAALAGVFSISMDLAPLLLVWALAAIAALALAHRSELEALPSLGAPTGAGVRLGRGLGAAVSLLVVILVVGAGVFMLVPVAGTNRSLTFPASLPSSHSVPAAGGISNPSLGGDDPARPARPGQPSSGRASFGYFGFSDHLDTATRGRPDDTLVMRVRASSPDFWRGQTFDAWDGRVWSATQTRARTIRGGQPIDIPRVADDGPPFGITGTDELVQTYYLEKTGPNAIFAAATPTKVYFPDRTLFQVPDGSLRAGVRLDADSVYTVVSRRMLATPAALRAAAGLPAPAAILERYARPPTTTARVRSLARSATAKATTPYDRVLALETWIGAHTKYTLNIPPLPPGKDAVDQFLFVDRRGFCEQISTSLVVMLRSLGIPARLVVGYATGERNPFTGLYEVRAKDAHAWAEVYFPGVGWQGFDPTADVPLAGDSSLGSAGTGALSYLQAHVGVPAWALWALGAATLAVAAGFAACAVRRRRRSRPVPLTSWSATRLARLEELGIRRGRPRAPAETVPRYAAALGAGEPTAAAIAEAARVLDAAMFGPEPPDADACRRVDALLDQLETEWPTRRAPTDLLPTR